MFKNYRSAPQVRHVDGLNVSWNPKLRGSDTGVKEAVAIFTPLPWSLAFSHATGSKQGAPAALADLFPAPEFANTAYSFTMAWQIALPLVYGEPKGCHSLLIAAFTASSRSRAFPPQTV